MTFELFPGRLGIQQRVLPSYRGVFLDSLAKACQGGLSVFAGKPLPNEGIDTIDQLLTAQYVHAKNVSLSRPSSSLFVCWQIGFLRWLRDWHPDLLIIEANPRYPVTRLAIQWMHRRGRKVIGWGLGAPHICGNLARMRKWERLSLLNSLDAIIAYSQKGAEEYRQLGIPSELVFVAYNAVDLAPKTLPTKRMIRQGKARILFVGRLQARKRVDLLLRASADLPIELQPDLVIIGDGPARGQLELLASQIYPSANFAGAKHGSELEPYFEQADLFVLPGTGGLAIQQAMAHGLPVIVAHGDGTQDDLVRSDNGWQVTPDDVQALSNALLKALSDPDKLLQMGEASFRIVANEINVDKMVEVFIQALHTFDSRG